MANPSFIDAIDEFRRRSALVGRPAEKAAMDKSLRENAIRRLTTTRDRVAPVTPAISEVVQDGGEGPMTPQGFDSAIGTTPSIQGTTDLAQQSINAGKLGLPTSPPEGFLDYAKAAWDFLNITNPKTFIPKLTYNLIKGDESSETGKQGVEFGLATTPSFNPETGLPQGFTSQGTPVSQSEADMASAILGGEAAGANIGPAPSQGGESPTVLCTELYGQGLLPLEIYLADSRYGSKLAPETLAGYHIWAEPLAKAMSQSKALTSIVSPFVKAWAYEMAYREGVLSKGNWLGKALSFIGEPVCGFIGRSFNNGYEPDFH